MEQDSAHLSTHPDCMRRPPLVLQTAAAGSVLLLDQAAVGQRRSAGLADTVVGWLAGVGTALGRPVVPPSAVPRLAHAAVPEVAGAGSAAVQPHRVGLCMAPPQLLYGMWLAVVSRIDCAPVGQADPIVIVLGDGLFFEWAAAWYRGLPVCLGHQVSVPPAALMKLATLATSVSVSTAVRVIQQMVSSQRLTTVTAATAAAPVGKISARSAASWPPLPRRWPAGLPCRVRRH
jgi:hypothetical protein